VVRHRLLRSCRPAPRVAGLHHRSRWQQQPSPKRFEEPWITTAGRLRSPIDRGPKRSGGEGNQRPKAFRGMEILGDSCCNSSLIRSSVCTVIFCLDERSTMARATQSSAPGRADLQEVVLGSQLFPGGRSRPDVSVRQSCMATRFQRGGRRRARTERHCSSRQSSFLSCCSTFQASA